MAEHVDFTAYRHPVEAVPCPHCRARAGQRCRRPSEHEAQGYHRSRGRAADELFIAQHGEDASIERSPSGWRVDPVGLRTAEVRRA